MAQPILDIASLTPEERLRLIGQLWDSLEDSDVVVRLTPAQEAELDRRVKEFESEEGEPQGIPWDEVLRQIRQHKQ